MVFKCYILPPAYNVNKKKNRHNTLNVIELLHIGSAMYKDCIKKVHLNLALVRTNFN